MAAQVLATTKNDLIIALVQKELKEAATLTNYLTDFSALASKGVNNIKVPKLSSFTVQDRAFGAAATEATALTDTVDSIPLDKNKIILFGYDSNDEVQSSIDYKMMAIQRASAAHGRQVNSDIITMWTSVAGLNINAGVAADININAILDMREYMLKSYANMAQVALILGTDQEKAMLKLAEFSRYDYRGNGASPIVNGVIGFVYGIPVIVNTQVATQQAFMVSKDGSGFAFQKQPNVAENPKLAYGTGGLEVAVDCLYGVGGLQIEQNGAAATKSPLIAKLKN